MNFNRVILYYNFVPIADPEAVKLWQKTLCESLNIKGRILISSQGINGTLGGHMDDIKKYIKNTREYPGFKKIDFKWSQGTGNDFPKLKIQVRNELVAFGYQDEIEVDENAEKVFIIRADLNFNIIDKNVYCLQNEETIYSLYLQVAKNSPFNTFILPLHHFSTFKEKLGDDFIVRGYFLENQLVGFTSLIRHGKELETYFLGFDNTIQREKMLYLNRSYDLPQQAPHYVNSSPGCLRVAQKQLET